MNSGIVCLTADLQIHFSVKQTIFREVVVLIANLFIRDCQSLSEVWLKSVDGGDRW